MAEVCLLEAEPTRDREVAEMLLLKAGRYLEEAKRLMATRTDESGLPSSASTI
jgi:hypothetical protein